MTTALAAVRIDPDGTRSNLPLPPAQRDAILREELGGWPEFAHYGRQDGDVVCAIVHETSLLDGMPANPVATAVVEQLRGEPLSYRLHGPVILLGYLPRSDVLVDLPETVREVLHAAAQRLDGAHL